MKPLHDWLRHAAGRFGRYERLAKAIRDLSYHCAVVVNCKLPGSVVDEREWASKVPKLFEELMDECDRITKRET